LRLSIAAHYVNKITKDHSPDRASRPAEWPSGVTCHPQPGPTRPAGASAPFPPYPSAIA
jgi:hypothetical protein